MVQIHSPRFRFNDLTRLCSRALGARRRISCLLSRVSPPDPEMRGAVSHPVSQGIERAHNRPGKNSIARDPAGRRPESSRRGFGLAGWRELAPSCASPRRARHVPRRTPNPCWPDRPIPPDRPSSDQNTTANTPPEQSPCASMSVRMEKFELQPSPIRRFRTSITRPWMR